MQVVTIPEEHLVEVLSTYSADQAPDKRVRKSSRLHVIRSMERKFFGLRIRFIHFVARSSHWSTGV